MLEVGLSGGLAIASYVNAILCKNYNVVYKN